MRHTLLRSEEDLAALLASGMGDWRWPCVVKPSQGAGSYHISKVESREELTAIMPDLRQALATGGLPEDSRQKGFLLEEYIAGVEVDVDGWARHGVLEFCLVSDNRPAKEPHFQELGGIYPSQLPKHQVKALEELTRDVLAAFPGLHGAFHFEAKLDATSGGAVVPIEWNARLGGAECPSSVEAVTGYYLPVVAARLALDLSVPAPVGGHRHPVVASTNLHHFESGVFTACSKEAVDIEGCKVVSCELFGKVGNRHTPSTGSISCLGWIATGGASVAEAEGNLQQACSQVHIVIEEEVEAPPAAKRMKEMS